MKTKEQAVREEVAFGKEAGMLPDLVRAFPKLSVDRLNEIAGGAPMEEAEVDAIFAALNLDEDWLDDEEDQ
jgi:hypothetical protein